MVTVVTTFYFSSFLFKKSPKFPSHNVAGAEWGFCLVLFVRILVYQCVSNPSFWFIQDLVYFEKVIITGLYECETTDRACIFLGFRNVHGNRSSLVCGVGFSASWLIVRARVIATALMIAIVPFSPPVPNSTRPWPSSNEKWEIFGLTSRVSASCVTRNHRKLWWLVFLPPKGFDWGFLLYLKKHATHSGWILTYLLPSLYSYQIEVDTLLLKKKGFCDMLEKTDVGCGFLG